MNLPRIIIGIWLLAPCSTAFTPHRRGYYDRRASHRLYDTSVSDFWSSVAATAISPNEAFLTTVSLASVSALVGAANAGLAARESQRQSEMKDKLESQQADLGKFQKSVENLNRLAQVRSRYLYYSFRIDENCYMPSDKCIFPFLRMLLLNCVRSSLLLVHCLPHMYF